MKGEVTNSGGTVEYLNGIPGAPKPAPFFLNWYGQGIWHFWPVR
jgi:hypothetical protein